MSTRGLGLRVSAVSATRDKAARWGGGRRPQLLLALVI